MQIAQGKRLYIQEVSVRDGFQIEPRFIPTEDKIALVDALSQTGVSKIEVTSFSSPKAIPALADAAEVMQGIQRHPGVEYAVLVPNLRGAARALDCDVDEINVVVSASRTHNLANLRMTPEQSLTGVEEIMRLAEGEAMVNASLSTAFGCPFDGVIADAQVEEFVSRLVDLGIPRITLCDTTGMAHPVQVERLCRRVLERWPHTVFTLHFHNTRAMGLPNVLAALEAGIDRFDASLGGLGGCPFAPGASGNVCTEDLVHMLQAMGYATGVRLDILISAAQRLPALVGHDVPGQVMVAGPWDKRYPVPEGLGSVQQALAGAACAVSAQATKPGRRT